MPELTGIIETCLYVADLARATEFYERVFGLRRIAGDDRFTALSVAGKHVLLLFLQGGTTQPMQLPGGVIPPHDGSGELHFAFSCVAEELPKWEAHLASHKITIEGRVEWKRGGISIYFRYPDGHLV